MLIKISFLKLGFHNLAPVKNFLQVWFSCNSIFAIYFSVGVFPQDPFHGFLSATAECGCVIIGFQKLMDFQKLVATIVLSTLGLWIVGCGSSFPLLQI